MHGLTKHATMPLPQARIPSPYAIGKLLLRVVSLLLSIIVLIFLIYMSARYKRNFPVAYAAVSLLRSLIAVQD